MRPGETRDIHADMMRLTLSIIARVMFDSDVTSAADDLVRAVNTIVALFGDGPLEFFEFIPWMDKLPLPAHARLKEAVSTIDEIILRVIHERRSHADLGTDLLGMLLSARDESGAALTDSEVRDEIKTIFLAGHETAALTLSFAFVLLSQSPEASKKLAAELDEVLGQRKPSAEDFPRLRFTHAVVLESLRIYPPVWTIGREALVDTELSGYHIPRGGQVWMSPWVNHRDPRYFSDPERFFPDRWLDGLEKRLPRGVFLPFGGGPRICIANMFAIMEAVLVLATLARRLSIQVQVDKPQELDPLVTLRPKGPVLARIEARRPAA
jgi:cytochrome P450